MARRGWSKKNQIGGGTNISRKSVVAQISAEKQRHWQAQQLQTGHDFIRPLNRRPLRGLTAARCHCNTVAGVDVCIFLVLLVTRNGRPSCRAHSGAHKCFLLQKQASSIKHLPRRRFDQFSRTYMSSTSIGSRLMSSRAFLATVRSSSCSSESK